VDPRAGLDDVEKRKFLTLSGLELRPLGRPARTAFRVLPTKEILIHERSFLPVSTGEPSNCLYFFSNAVCSSGDMGAAVAKTNCTNEFRQVCLSLCRSVRT
jgi:hypothetical protein